jgi:hypothetical protein
MYNSVLSLVGLSVDSFADQEDSDYFLEGIAAGLDDNILYGWYNRLVGLDKNEDEFFYLTGHQIVSEASIAFWATTTIDSALASQASFALSSAEATGGLLLEATGVGAPGGLVLQADALKNVAIGAATGLVSTMATSATAHSVALLNSSTGKLNNLPTYNAGNLNTKLKATYGNPPSYMSKPQAHHVFPQKFRDYFKNVLMINLQLINLSMFNGGIAPLIKVRLQNTARNGKHSLTLIPMLLWMKYFNLEETL